MSSQPKQSATADDIYRMIVSGEIFVDLAAAALAEPERVLVFESEGLSEKRAHNHTPPSFIAPRAQYFEVTQGTRINWGRNTYEIANVDDNEICLLGGTKPIELTHRDFDELVRRGKIVIIASEREITPYEEGLEIIKNASPGRKLTADRREAKIKPFLNGEKKLLGQSKERTYRRWISRYREAERRYGNGYVGLLTNNHHAGNRNPRFPPRVEQIIRETVNEYEKTTQKTIVEVHGEAINKCKAENFGEEFWPTLTTIWNRINSRPKDEQTLNRKGRRAAYKYDTRTLVYWLEADTPPQGDRPFEIAHADFTKADIRLVDSVTGKDLGRPWIGFLVDAYTRRLLAIVVTFDPPSYRSVMLLMRECLRRFGKLPETLIVDNGKEFDNLYLKRLANTFTFTLKFRPKGRPKFGSVGERLFGIVTKSFIHNLVGNTQLMKDVRQVTKSVNPTNLAAWTIDHFSEWLSAWGYKIYDTRPHWKLNESPAELFARSVKLTGIRKGRLIYDEILVLLTLPTTRKGTAKNQPDKGVKINYIYYRCTELNEGRYQNKQLPILYDPFNLSEAYVQIGGRWVKCYSEYYNLFRFLTERQLKMITAELRRRTSQFMKMQPITAASIAEFIVEAEKLQKTLIAKRFSRLRGRDREALLHLLAANGGSSTPIYNISDVYQPLTSVIESTTQPSASHSSENIDADSVGYFEELS